MNHWNILLETTADGLTTATVLEVPELQIRDETKQGAVKKIQKLLQKRLGKAEIIKIPMSIKPLYDNPLMKFAGIFQDDPDFMEIIAEIRAEREENSEI
ncbi:MAG: hypothetical protein HC907_16165 [Richelia sp. SM1_7_0]|nr:hypothetical protein [Richelia sp. SM1_7_0]